MKQMAKKFLLGLLCVFMLAAAGGCKEDNEQAALDPAYEDETVIATVEGQDITRGDLNKRVDMLIASMGQQYQIEFTKEEYPEFYADLKDPAFEDLILGIMLDKDAEEAGFKVEKKELDGYIQELENYAESKEQTLDEYLQKLCATQEDMEIEYRRNAFVSEKQRQFAEDITISDEEAQEYYQANQAQFKTPAGTKMYHILVDEEALAKDLIQQIKDGADFSELAKENSKDEASAVQGGALGIVNETTNFVPEFKEAALKLEPGAFTEEPVKSNYGWHIIKAGDRVEESVQSFEDAKPFIEYSLKNVKMQENLKDYAEKLKERADVHDMREEQDRTPELKDLPDESVDEDTIIKEDSVDDIEADTAQEQLETEAEQK